MIGSLDGVLNWTHLRVWTIASHGMNRWIVVVVDGARSLINWSCRPTFHKDIGTFTQPPRTCLALVLEPCPWSWNLDPGFLQSITNVGAIVTGSLNNNDQRLGFVLCFYIKYEKKPRKHRKHIHNTTHTRWRKTITCTTYLIKLQTQWFSQL